MATGESVRRFLVFHAFARTSFARWGFLTAEPQFTGRLSREAFAASVDLS